MASPENQGRTEKPTAKRLQDAHKKNDYPRSQDLTQTVTLLGATLAMILWTPHLGHRLLDVIRDSLGGLGVSPVNNGWALAQFTHAFTTVLVLLAPFMVVLLVLSLWIQMAQTGNSLNLVTDNLKPKFEKLNLPKAFFKGLKRILGSVQTYFELLKSMVKVATIGGLAWYMVRKDVATMQNWSRLPSLTDILVRMGWLIFRVALSIILFLLALSILDYLWQRRQFMKKLQMSKNDVKEEYKQMEGDPKIKGKRRQMQVQMAMRRMMAAVPTADVVITNPTHFAVALSYEPSRMRAPVVVAKGQDRMALRIRDLAREHGVTVVENPPLARGIYHATDLEQPIPDAFFRPVAEILAFIYRRRGRKVS